MTDTDHAPVPTRLPGEQLVVTRALVYAGFQAVLASPAGIDAERLAVLRDRYGPMLERLQAIEDGRWWRRLRPLSEIRAGLPEFKRELVIAGLWPDPPRWWRRRRALR